MSFFNKKKFNSFLKYQFSLNRNSNNSFIQTPTKIQSFPEIRKGLN